MGQDYLQIFGRRKNIITLKKKDGGMALPNMKDYFYSAQLKPLLSLCNKDYNSRWKDTEISLTKNYHNPDNTC